MSHSIANQTVDIGSIIRTPTRIWMCVQDNTNTLSSLQWRWRNCDALDDPNSYAWDGFSPLQGEEVIGHVSDCVSEGLQALHRVAPGYIFTGVAEALAQQEAATHHDPAPEPTRYWHNGPIGLTDGEYILTQDVTSPLPASAQRGARSRGWMREPRWREGTPFVLLDGTWSCGTHFGYDRKPMSPRHRRMVLNLIKANLVPWSPTLPSHIMGSYDGTEVLDFMVAAGKLSLADVREAYASRTVATVIADGMSELCKAPEPPKPGPKLDDLDFSGPWKPELRAGDIVGDIMNGEYVMLRPTGDGYYEWRSVRTLSDSAQTRASFAAPWHPPTEPVTGNIADMLVEGLQSLHATRTPSSSLRTTIESRRRQEPEQLSYDPFSLD